MVVLLHRATLELCQSDHQVIVHFGRAASSRKSVGHSKLLPFKNDHCVFGDNQCCRNVLLPFPRSVPRHKHISELYGPFI
jgi:hypothetical protein